MLIKINKLKEYAITPVYAQFGDAGADLSYCSDFENERDTILLPGQRKLFGTGIALEIPYGFVGLVHPRSGLAAKKGLTVLNAPGTIDCGYRGEIKVNLINLSDEDQIIKPGDRIAQLVIQQIVYASFIQVDSLSETARSINGHGSTGDTHLANIERTKVV